MQETLKALRTQNKKTVAEIATELQVSVRAYYSYEQGTRMLSLDKLKPLSEILNCSVEEVVEAQLNSCQFYIKDNLH